MWIAKQIDYNCLVIKNTIKKKNVYILTNVQNGICTLQHSTISFENQ